ncbi:MAG: ATP-binding protein [Acidimicrobiales bacterium]
MTTPLVSERLSGDAGSIRAARALVGDLLGEEPAEGRGVPEEPAEGRGVPEVPAEVRDVAVLLTDELVTNALVHGGGRFTLRVDLDDRAVRVAVTDQCRDTPRVLRPSSEREHGRGMAIVDALATTWGTDQLPTHKAVWFELALRS